MEQFILASASPRRKELLLKLVPEFAVVPPSINEDGVQANFPAELAMRLATLKANDVAEKNPEAVVIGCDTIVEIDGKPLGKPHSKGDAQQMLRLLSGRVHSVHTGVCMQKGTAQTCFVESSKVTFAILSSEEIAQYISSDEPYDKAGGYAIQGQAAKFVTEIRGCYFNIMGLPVAHLYRVLKQQGYL